MSATTFHTITADDWRRMFARAREEGKRDGETMLMQIRAGLARENFTVVGSASLAGREAERAEVGGGEKLSLCVMPQEARPSGNATGGTGSSSAVSSATAGRDRRNFHPMSTTVTESELIHLLRDIADESSCFDDGPRPYSGDSYLPERLKERIRRALASTSQLKPRCAGNPSAGIATQDAA